MTVAQVALGHSVTILGTRIGDEAPVLNGVEVQLFPCELSPWRWSKGLARALPILVAKADIVHIHTVWQYPTWVASAICQSLRKPYIIRPCGMLEEWSLSQSSFKKKLYLLLGGKHRLRNATALHFTSNSERQKSMRLSKDFVLPIGLSPSAYENLPPSTAFATRFPILKNRQIVLFLGRLHYKKQPDLAIKAFARACRDDSDACLVLAGPGEPNYVSRLKDLAHELGIAEKVVFVGMLEGVVVREAYTAAALFVLPSLQENFGISVAEAMAAGCPVVISDEVALSSVVVNANAGLVCKLDADSVANAIASLISDEDSRKSMGERGRQIILDKFTWKQIAGRLDTVYADILADKKDRG